MEALTGPRAVDRTAVREKLIQRIAKSSQKAHSEGVKEQAIISALSNRGKKTSLCDKLKRNWFVLSFAVLVAAVFAPHFCMNEKYEFDFSILRSTFEEALWSRCIVDNHPVVMEVARPVANCRMCTGLKEVPILYNLTSADFVQTYAYGGKPALVRGSMGNWSSLNVFSFDYFKQLYKETEDSFRLQEEECQFFPYNTDVFTLEDFFKFSDSRAALDKGEKTWYIGWSNCHPEIAESLRRHYQRPSFLPEDSESSSIDWIFMGWSGEGANMHLDYVQRPSWQAQVSGRKSWSLVPAPECEHVCSPLNVTVETGDIILIDTNQWYHSTWIHPGEISITIGSEYD